MAEIKIVIPNNKVALVLDAFADARGIDATPAALKQEFVDEIKSVVKRYKLKRIEMGQDTELKATDLTVNIT